MIITIEVYWATKKINYFSVNNLITKDIRLYDKMLNP